jgi:hypothetical protein
MRMAPVVLRIVIGAALVALCAWGLTWSRTVARRDTSFALANNLGYFSAEYGRLPTDWNEFIHWKSENRGGTRWTIDQLSNSFSLEWGIDQSAMLTNQSSVLHVLDSGIQKWELPLNELLKRRAEVQFKYGSRGSDEGHPESVD